MKTTQAAQQAHSSAVLFRSRIEIARILNEMAADRTVVCAEVDDGERLFLTRVLRIEQEAGFFFTGYAEEKTANAAILECRSVSFTAQHRLARVEFSAEDPQDALVESEAAIRWRLPAALVQMPRRIHARYCVKPDVSLRCVADGAGFASFEARIADISQGGMGAMIYDGAIRLAPGTVLKGCRVVVPGREAVVVDVEVRYSVPAVLADGTLVNRAGVRLLKASPDLEALLSNFVVSLENEAPV